MLHQLKDTWQWLLIALGFVVVLVFATVVYPAWRGAVERNEDARADAHHIAGNLYFVGDPSNASFLLVAPEGDVLIAAGEERSAHKIVDNIAQLGFDIKDVRILLASAPAAVFTPLQKASGADLWASDDTASVLANGGVDDPSVVYTPWRFWAWARVTDYPPAQVQHRVRDGDTLRLGPLAVTAHLTPATSRGCVTWTFVVRDHDRDLHVVHRCGLNVPVGASLVPPEKYPGVRAAFEHTFVTLRALPVEIWLTAQGREYGRYRKYQESLSAPDPAAPFIDPDGYRQSIDEAEASFRKQLAEQQQQKQQR